VIWDLIRLELVAHEEDAQCYFVLGGKRRDLEAFFDNDSFSDTKQRYHKPLLNIRHNSLHRVYLVPVVQVRIPLLRNLFKDYQDFDFPQFFVAQRCAPFPSEQVLNGYQIYVWRIMPNGRRDTFKPRNSRHYFFNDES